MTPRSTPVEVHRVDGFDVYVKREDLCWMTPGLSKVRGLYRVIGSRSKSETIAAVNTGHSWNGLAIASVATALGYSAVIGYPRYKARPDEIPPKTLAIREHFPSVELLPLQANRQFMMLFEAKTTLKERGRPFYLLPTGLKLPETADAVEAQMRAVLREFLIPGTVVVPTGTGTHAAGILRAFDGDVALVLGYSRSVSVLLDDIERLAPGRSMSRVTIVPSLDDYADEAPDVSMPWSGNPRYEGKAFTWLRTALPSLRQPVLFWNIGS